VNPEVGSPRDLGVRHYILIQINEGIVKLVTLMAKGFEQNYEI
jgi:hypothetical protein